MKTITLYRPVGASELALIRQKDFKEFPPRLPSQPIFYPVLSEEYAVQIARDWNAKSSGSGYVTRFQVNASFLAGYEVHTVGGATHKEYWIPAAELAEFNEHIVGNIELISEFHEK